jgi:geranylgeranyl diphosphate synthase type I
MLLSYCGYARITPTKKTYQWAASLEIIQTFILIHDDLIDQSLVRRGGPALHQGLAGLYGNIQRGRDLALVYGDMLFALGLKQFLGLPSGEQEKIQALHLLLDSALLTGLGELNDVTGDILSRKATPQEIYRMYDQKTGHYSFITPLVIGATLAGQKKPELKKLQCLGQAIGRAFQLRDDLLDSTASTKTTGKTTASDVHNSKLTLLNYYTLNSATGPQQKKLQATLEKQKKTAADIRFVKQLYQRTGAIEKIKTELGQYALSAQKLLAKTSLRSPEKTMIKDILDQLFF